MKTSKVLQQSLQLYRKNWGDLMQALLVELALRGICLAPLMFLTSPGMEMLALACIPLYLLVVLPARENYALALQQMLAGGRVLSPQLISVENYGRKLLRGLCGLGRMLLWSLLPAAGVTLAWMAYNDAVDAFTLLRILARLGGDTTGGLMVYFGMLGVSLLLPLFGCALHSGTRHAVALGKRGLLKGRRMRIVQLWLVGLVFLIPFVLVLGLCLGDYALAFVSQVKDLLTSGMIFAPLGARPWIVLAAAAVLLLPALPVKNMLPAVYLRAAAEEVDDAQA